MIVVVDDMHPVRLVVSRALFDAGYDVLSAPDAAAATIILSGLHDPPQLLISDLRMPGLDGAAFVPWLRLRYPTVPVLVISGFATLETEVELGVPVLPKPFTPAVLLDRVRAVLAQAHQPS